MEDFSDGEIVEYQEVDVYPKREDSEIRGHQERKRNSGSKHSGNVREKRGHSGAILREDRNDRPVLMQDGERCGSPTKQSSRERYSGALLLEDREPYRGPVLLEDGKVDGGRQHRGPVLLEDGKVDGGRHYHGPVLLEDGKIDNGRQYCGPVLVEDGRVDSSRQYRGPVLVEDGKVDGSRHYRGPVLLEDGRRCKSPLLFEDGEAQRGSKSLPSRARHQSPDLYTGKGRSDSPLLHEEGEIYSSPLLLEDGELPDDNVTSSITSSRGAILMEDRNNDNRYERLERKQHGLDKHVNRLDERMFRLDREPFRRVESYEKEQELYSGNMYILGKRNNRELETKMFGDSGVVSDYQAELLEYRENQLKQMEVERLIDEERYEDSWDARNYSDSRVDSLPRDKQIEVNQGRSGAVLIEDRGIG